MAELLPHAGRMVLLKEVREHGEDRAVCIVQIERDDPFLEANGLVPAWVALEYMGQCIAALAGLLARATGLPVKIGFLVGSRRVDFSTAGFRAGQRLEVSAVRVWGEREYASFACVVRDADTSTMLAQANLNVYQPNSMEQLMERTQS